MASISFETLYSANKNIAQSLFLVWINDFFGSANISSVHIDYNNLSSFIENLREDDFPANGGFSKASPFKKVACIFVWLHALNPFITPLSKDIVGEHIATFQNNTATIIGYYLAKTCLKGATLYEKSGKSITLDNEISVSRHFLGDLVEASNMITPTDHFQLYALLFESLANRFIHNILLGWNLALCIK